jgi:hypothetical protein
MLGCQMRSTTRRVHKHDTQFMMQSLACRSSLRPESGWFGQPADDAGARRLSLLRRRHGLPARVFADRPKH